jgi:hypothetical protein
VEAIDVAMGAKLRATIFLGLFSLDVNLDVAIPAAIVLEDLSMME